MILENPLETGNNVNVWTLIPFIINRSIKGGKYGALRS